MTQAEQIIQKALSFVGTTENPPYSNNVIFNTDYYGHEVSGNYPWCCTFVWDIFRMCGLSDLFCDGVKTAYCPFVMQWGKNAGQTVGINKAVPGDIVLFDWNHNGTADHIGFILKRNSDGTYQTIEGNTSETSNDNGGKVMVRKRYQPDICCIIRPKYKEDEDMTKEETQKLIDETLQKVLVGAGTEPSPWIVATGELERAKEFGISDGTRPQGYAKREEVAAMIVRAVDKYGKDPKSEKIH